MANIPTGDYYILNAANVALALDVAGSNFTNEANIQLWTRLQNDAQRWHVSTRSNGTIKMVSPWCGKGVDIRAAQMTAGTNIQLFSDNNTLAQQWVATEVGTASVNGASYPTYYIAPQSNQTLRMYADGTSAGANVRLSANPTSTRAQWIFLPVPYIRSGGLYEIRSLLDTKCAVSVPTGNVASGSNVYLNPTTGSNSNKWVITLESGTDKYSIRSCNKGLYMDVEAAYAADGTNVRLWGDNDTDAQRWKIDEYGTMRVDGKECVICRIGSYVAGSGMTYMLDVLAANTKSGNNVQIWTANATDAQKFVLVPTEATDATMPTPYDVGVTDSPTGEAYDYNLVGDDDYVTWKCSAAWVADGTNHYEIRQRSRTMSPTRSAWSEWSEWTAWEPAWVSKQQLQVWLHTDGLGDYTWGESKNRECEIQVRSCGTEGTALLHGAYTDKVINKYKVPNIEITQAGWTPHGLHIGWTSDYLLGSNYLNVTGITVDGENALTCKERLWGNTSHGEVVLDRSKLSKWIEDGDQVDIKYSVGYDQCNDLRGTERTETVTVTYYSGTTAIEPVFERVGSHLYATIANLGKSRAWVSGGGDMVECYEVETGNPLVSKFEILYPTDGSEFPVFFETVNTDGNEWGTDVEYEHMRKKCFAWTVGGKTVYLDEFKTPSYKYSEKATYQSDSLDSRKYEQVSFSPTHKRSTSVTGVLVPDSIDTAKDFEALVGTHAIFRDVNGGIYNAAVTGVSVNSTDKYSEITVEMTIEN